MEKQEYLLKTATLLRLLAAANEENKDFLAVAKLLERLAKVFRERESRRSDLQ